MEAPPAAWAQAREQFLSLVEAIRPELHRYCARLTGSVIQGEDIVQESLAKAFYAMTQQLELPPLRPWLFKIAHNAAIDHLRSHGHRFTESRAELDEMSNDETIDPFAVRAALAQFLALTVPERSAVILKDVLGHSLEEAAETMGATVPAVKAALVRGRAKLRAAPEAADGPGAGDRAQLDEYVRLFNARDWDGVRALVGEDCRLDLVTKSQRRGKSVGAYFGRYEKEQVQLAVAIIDGQLMLVATEGDQPPYPIQLVFDEAGKVAAIRDFRYVRYLLGENANSPHEGGL